MIKKDKFDIYERLQDFALSILSLTKNIPHTFATSIILKQLVRSSCSIGANAAEASAAETRKEFIYQLVIAKKEAVESEYWLNLLFHHNPSFEEDIKLLKQEIKQIIAILSKIILNTKQNTKI